jgi:hypothetical protein
LPANAAIQPALLRSILFAAPIIALLYSFGTGAILAVVPAAEVNLIGPIPQALSVGLRSFGLAKVLAPLTIPLLWGMCCPPPI